MDVIYIDDFLSDEVLKTCQDYIDNFYGQGIVGDKSFVNNFWEENKEKIQNINSDWIGLYNNVTKTNSSKPVNKHLDKKIRNEKYKMFIYLNEVPNGGTIFFDGADEQLVENKLNRLVIFNIGLYHKSQNFLVGDNTFNKKLIGFRLINK
jgi:hypothetical protein